MKNTKAKKGRKRLVTREMGLSRVQHFYLFGCQVILCNLHYMLSHHGVPLSPRKIHMVQYATQQGNFFPPSHARSIYLSNNILPLKKRPQDIYDFLILSFFHSYHNPLFENRSMQTMQQVNTLLFFFGGQNTKKW